ncbi:MAG: hypothetical protein QG590_47, partial [Pseudomonadota bacterium]|nr:hypothetical protein [Pseudomonadota bacterium]
MRLDNLVTDGQPEAGSTGTRTGAGTLHEFFEDDIFLD